MDTVEDEIKHNLGLKHILETKSKFRIEVRFSNGICLLSREFSEKDARTIIAGIANHPDVCTLEFNSEDWIIHLYGSEKSLVYFFPKREIKFMTLVERKEN